MKPVWHDTLDAPIASDGRAVLVGHIVSREQAERWQAKGYDIAQATDRYVGFVTSWRDATDWAAADKVVDAFYAAETDQLRALGITETDPDFFRVQTAAKHHEWA